MPAIWSTSMESPLPELVWSGATIVSRDRITGASVFSGVMAAEPLTAPAIEGAVQDMRPGLFTQAYQEPDVVDRDQAQPEHVFDHEQVPEITPRIRGAGLTIAGGIERLGRTLQPCASHIDPAIRQPGRSVPAVA